MREKMITDRNARVMAHRFISMNLGPMKRCFHRHFRRIANREVGKVLKSGDYDSYSGPNFKHRLTGWDVA